MMPLRAQAFHSGGLSRFLLSLRCTSFASAFCPFPPTHSLSSSSYRTMRPYVIIAAAAALLPAMVSAQGAPPTWCVPSATLPSRSSNIQLTFPDGIDTASSTALDRRLQSPRAPRPTINACALPTPSSRASRNAWSRPARPRSSLPVLPLARL